MMAPNASAEDDKPKEQYCAVPVSAMSDARLSATDWRVLAVIAWHDRFGRNGIGCYARHEILSAETGVEYSSLSRSIARLVECGYISKTRHQLNKRLRVYRVMYNDNSGIVGKCANYEAPDTDANDVDAAHLANLPSIKAPHLAGPLGQAAEKPTAISSKYIPRSGSNLIDPVKQQMHPSGLGVSDRDSAADIAWSQILAPGKKDFLQWGELIPLVARLAGISQEHTSGLLAAVTEDTYNTLAAPDLSDDRRIALFRAAVASVSAAA